MNDANMVDVSIILPALSPNDQYRRCLYSIRTALAGQVRYEIICIVRDVEIFSELESSDLHIIKEDGPGIYAAMNQGLLKANGEFVYFIGQDDILLPSASNAIKLGLATGTDLIIADVFYGQKSIFRNYASKHVLAWRNWCHQGLFYNRRKFIEAVISYPVKFIAQADHYANLVFVGAPGVTIVKFSQCVAWYSFGGFSSQTMDYEFRAEFPRLILEKIGFLDYVLVISRRYILDKIIRRNA